MRSRHLLWVTSVALIVTAALIGFGVFGKADPAESVRAIPTQESSLSSCPPITAAAPDVSATPPATAGPGQAEVRLKDGTFVIGDVVPWPPPPGTPGYSAPHRPVPTSTAERP